MPDPTSTPAPTQSPLTAIANIAAPVETNYPILKGLVASLTAAALQSVNVIHFARFLFLAPNANGIPTQFAVITSYDGTFDQYIEDFIHQTEDIFDGIVPYIEGAQGFYPIIKHAEAFKAWLKTKDVPVNFWYSAYPTMTVLQIQACGNNKPQS